jgi:hypothetical protein
MSSSEIVALRTLLPPLRSTLGTRSPAHHTTESRHHTDLAVIFTVCLCTANSGNIHNPKAKDGGEQPHAHVMLTMREIGPDGFGLKRRDGIQHY